MNEIRFVVVKRLFSHIHTPGTFTLVSDNWDDFHFRTSYRLYYTFSMKKTIEIGYVKIASIDNKKDSIHTKLPDNFNELPGKFFSLGQGREYYEKFMTLPQDVRDVAFRSLRDIVANRDIYNEFQEQEVFSSSLLRDIPPKTVTTQFRRIIAGHAPLVPFSFSYTRNFEHNDTPSLILDFNVNYESALPTNTHVIIGANGTGKSTLLRDFVSAAVGSSAAQGLIQSDLLARYPEPFETPFVNVVHIAFSAFEQEYSKPIALIKGVKIHAVGLSVGASLEEQFIDSLQNCSVGSKRGRWISVINKLEAADPLLADIGVRGFIDSDIIDEDAKSIMGQFMLMSSGHKIVILTITRLVELVEEESLILLDEPETHLHPTLLSALIRSVSDLATDRNGVAVVATHSPVVLQEVPQSCVWRLQRSGNDLRASRLNIESFGESVSILTSEVFRLDVSKTGYHEVLSDQLSKNNGSVNLTLQTFDNQIGQEARFILESLAYERKEDDV